MANLPVISSPVSIVSADTYIIGQGSEHSASTCLIQFTNSSFTGSVTIKARKARSAGAFVPIPYIRRDLAGTVSDDTSVTAAITAAAMIKVDATGLQIAIDCTAFTTGALVTDFQFVEGVAAR